MPTTFIAKASAFQIVREQGRRIYEGQEAVGWTDPTVIEFHRGTYTTSDADEITFLRAAKTFNNEFWEMGNEPGSMQPSTPVLMGKIADYAVDHDAEKLRSLVAHEQDTYGDLARQDVIDAAQRALGRMGDLEHGKRGPGRPKAQVA